MNSRSLGQFLVEPVTVGGHKLLLPDMTLKGAGCERV